MLDRDREQTSSFWGFVYELVLGGLRRRIDALEDENTKLDARITELERRVARQGGELKALTMLVPAAARRLTEAETFAERSDPPTKH